MVKPRTLKVKGSDIAIITRQEDDYISITDIARHKNPDAFPNNHRISRLVGKIAQPRLQRGRIRLLYTSG